MRTSRRPSGTSSTARSACSGSFSKRRPRPIPGVAGVAGVLRVRGSDGSSDGGGCGCGGGRGGAAASHCEPLALLRDEPFRCTAVHVAPDQSAPEFRAPELHKFCKFRQSAPKFRENFASGFLARAQDESNFFLGTQSLVSHPNFVKFSHVTTFESAAR